ncbi:RICIN domain-containing protein [Streptomyces sp. DSM 40907]|uniref:RICIN domain-containing protein n=1 Tax=Streptomyces kutzneri TaxID=3051179 RepID=UPI0028D57EF8|nr:RICIN domain-containing protein [Streptomyces sp. DSM 40907]
MVAATFAIGMLVAVKPAPAEAATVDSNAWYVLVNRNSGTAVEVQSTSTADGGNVVQYTDWGGANQQWQMIKMSSGGGGYGSTPTLVSAAHKIQSSGKSHSFILRVPDNSTNSQPYRLIFAHHWRGGTAGEVASGGTSGKAWSYYGQQKQPNNSATIVAPQGLGNGWAHSGGEDVTLPIAYFGIHGVSDSVLNITQGRPLRDRFVNNNGCTPKSPREPAPGSRTYIITTYSGCRAGYPLQWAAFDGGHLPGPVDGSPNESGVATWTKGKIWRFFAQFQ